MAGNSCSFTASFLKGKVKPDLAHFNFSVYTDVATLPEGWDAIAEDNIFLSSAYLGVLQHAAPPNMQCHFISLFKNDTLCGIALAQYINLSAVNTFSARQQLSIKNRLFKKFTSHTIVIGNNTLTGQNAYLFTKEIAVTDALHLLHNALNSLEKQYIRKGITVNILAIKDFNKTVLPDFKAAGYSGYFTFCTQPNMIFNINPKWNSIEDYLADLNTKYRTQYNRARKKAEGVEKRKLNSDEIDLLQERIYSLYLTVAGNASFNTFHLPANHFKVFKEQLKDNFLFYGYFTGQTLVGFSTLIKNGADMDTYFLGYDATIQKEKMLYLNMLYDMVAYAIKKRFKHVIFARSAMEIKSSVGAHAEDVYGIIKHTNPLINLFTKKLFAYFDPVVEWKPRSPFK